MATAKQSAERPDYKSMDDATLEKHIMRATREAIADAVRSKLSGYQSPLDEMITRVVTFYEPDLRALLSDAINLALHDEAWQGVIKDAVRAHLGKLLVSKMGGELEKQVNALKSDPTSRARITTAIDEAVRSMMK